MRDVNIWLKWYSTAVLLRHADGYGMTVYRTVLKKFLRPTVRYNHLYGHKPYKYGYGYNNLLQPPPLLLVLAHCQQQRQWACKFCISYLFIIILIILHQHNIDNERWLQLHTPVPSFKVPSQVPTTARRVGF